MSLDKFFSAVSQSEDVVTQAIFSKKVMADLQKAQDASFVTSPAETPKTVFGLPLVIDPEMNDDEVAIVSGGTKHIIKL